MALKEGAEVEVLAMEEELEDVVVKCLGNSPFPQQIHSRHQELKVLFSDGSPIRLLCHSRQSPSQAQGFRISGARQGQFQKNVEGQSFFLSSNREENLQGCGLDDEFAPVFRRLVNPFVGVPWAEANGTEEEAGANCEEEEDYRTEYLVQPIGKTEDDEGGSDFEPVEGDGEDDDLDVDENDDNYVVENQKRSRDQLDNNSDDEDRNPKWQQMGHHRPPPPRPHRQCHKESLEFLCLLL